LGSIILTDRNRLFTNRAPRKNKLMHSLNQTFKSLSVALVFASATSHAATVINPSFETDNVPDGGFFGSATGWTIPVGPAGSQDFSTQTPAATDGLQHGYANGGASLNQLTTETIIGGQTYTLTVDVGRESTVGSGLATLRLYGSTLGAGTAIAELTGIASVQGAYLLNQTFTYTAPAGGGAFNGQFVGISLIGQSGVQVLFDNVRFDVGAVPEPSSLLLGGLGALALLRRRRI
jgi:PEP-CTERM motif